MRSKACRKKNGRTAWLPVNMAKAGRNTPGLHPRKQAGDLPTVGSDELAMGFGWTVDQTLQPEASQVVGHLVGSVLGQRHAQQIRQQRHHPTAWSQPRRTRSPVSARADLRCTAGRTSPVAATARGWMRCAPRKAPHFTTIVQLRRYSER